MLAAKTYQRGLEAILALFTEQKAYDSALPVLSYLGVYVDEDFGGRFMTGLWSLSAFWTIYRLFFIRPT